ncbi:MBL fold metallo-hydrolase [Oceanobacillus kapialis]|uniref:MBL fold metallo-hydrolase n=1 Tax=Oceanobacillus kapialis TaxID=481353 RepID=UPI00384C2055
MFLKRIFPVNCYLIEEDHELTLIDAALPYSAKKILKTAQKIGKPITKVILTHGHGDHVGALDQIRELLPQAKVFISERDAKLLAGDRSQEPDEPQTPVRGDIPKNIKTKPDVLIQEGDRIGSLVSILTPGHTPGSMSFFDTRTKAMIVGDAFQLRGGIAVAGQMRWTFPFPAMATWDKELALESARKIESYQPSCLAVGHGRPLKNPLNQIRYAIINAEQNLQKNK